MLYFEKIVTDLGLGRCPPTNDKIAWRERYFRLKINSSLFNHLLHLTHILLIIFIIVVMFVVAKPIIVVEVAVLDEVLFNIKFATRMAIHCHTTITTLIQIMLVNFMTVIRHQACPILQSTSDISITVPAATYKFYMIASSNSSPPIHAHSKYPNTNRFW